MPVLLNGWFVIQGREVCNYYAVLRMKRNLHNSWYTYPKTWLILLTYQTNERRLGAFQLKLIVNERVKPFIQGRRVLKDTCVLTCFWCFTYLLVLLEVLSGFLYYLTVFLYLWHHDQFSPCSLSYKFSHWTDYSNTNVACLYLWHCSWLKK
jgi:hypothetical protein